MNTILKDNKWFFLPYLLLLIITATSLSFFNKGDFLLILNDGHHPALDTFFKLTNYLGEAMLFIVVLLVLLFVRLRYFLLGLSTLLVAGGAVQSLKHYVFNHMPRPYLFFEQVTQLYFVPGVKVYKHFSFPSGHTTVAFALFCFLALITPNKKLGLLFLMCAVLGGMARIYLAQHFLMDVFAGSILGSTIALIMYYLFARSHWYNNHNTVNKSLTGLIARR